MPKRRFFRLQLFETHSEQLKQTNRFYAVIDLDNSNARNVIQYIRMETEYDRPEDLQKAIKKAARDEKIESGRLWLTGPEFLQLASLMIHVEELFKTTYTKGTKESRKRMEAFRAAWKKLKKETWR